MSGLQRFLNISGIQNELPKVVNSMGLFLHSIDRRVAKLEEERFYRLYRIDKMEIRNNELLDYHKTMEYQKKNGVENS